MPIFTLLLHIEFYITDIWRQFHVGNCPFNGPELENCVYCRVLNVCVLHNLFCIWLGLEWMYCLAFGMCPFVHPVNICVCVCVCVCARRKQILRRCAPNCECLLLTFRLPLCESSVNIIIINFSGKGHPGQSWKNHLSESGNKKLLFREVQITK